MTIGDEIATELRTNLLRGRETKSLINRDWVRPGLYGILDVRADACLPSSHPLCAGQQRVLGFENCTTQLQPQYRCEWS